MSAAARLRPLIFASLAASLLAAVALLCVDRTVVVEAVKALVSTVQAAGVSGWLALVCIQTVVAVVGILPASVVGIAAGAIYGVWTGFVLAASSTLLGAGIAFWVGRSFLVPTVGTWQRGTSQISKLEALFTGSGWRFVCLVRMSPLMPFAATSYALALLPITLRAYYVGTLAALPSLFGCVLTGHLATATMDALQEQRLAQVTLLVVGAVATLLLVMHLGRIALRAVEAGQVRAPRAAEAL